MSPLVKNVYGPFFNEKELGLEGAPEEVKEQMMLLTKFVLTPVRKKFGKTLITSGYRSPEYNESLRDRGYNPAKNSQHIFGQAADFLCPEASSMREVFEWLKTWYPGVIIYYSKRGHIHVGLPTLERAKKGGLYGWTDPK